MQKALFHDNHSACGPTLDWALNNPFTHRVQGAISGFRISTADFELATWV